MRRDGMQVGHVRGVFTIARVLPKFGALANAPIRREISGL